MSRPKPETNLVNQMRVAIKKRWPSSWVLKTVGTGELAGIPDLFIIVAGRFVGIEVKKQAIGETEGHAYERTTPLQRATIAKIRRAGGVGGVALTVPEALELIELALMDPTPAHPVKVVP